jgi:hypothetical protein
MKKRERGSKQHVKEQMLIGRIKGRSNDAPMDGGAPSHLSYVSLLWSRNQAVRRAQMAAARAFLKDQQADPKSLLHKFEVIGPLEVG